MITKTTSELRIDFMKALDNGNYAEAQAILLELLSYYKENGYDTAMECIRFEAVVTWFRENIVMNEAVLV